MANNAVKAVAFCAALTAFTTLTFSSMKPAAAAAAPNVQRNLTQGVYDERDNNWRDHNNNDKRDHNDNNWRDHSNNNWDNNNHDRWNRGNHGNNGYAWGHDRRRLIEERRREEERRRAAEARRRWEHRHNNRDSNQDHNWR